MKRLALYVHHDPKGDVRDYILYCLKGLQEVVDDILFIVNGSITPQGRKDIEKLGIKILVRENQGFDWWAWKAGIEYYGYEKIAEYDELLLTNNTYYGPIYPFSEMWSEMDKRDCDFWGINRHRETDEYWIPEDKSSKMQEHIQSYWLVFRKRILISDAFKNYWLNLRPHNSFKEMVGYGETKLTKYFENQGYKSDTYMNHHKYDTLINSNPCFLSAHQVIKDKSPILKRKYLYDDYFNNIDLSNHSNLGPKSILKFLQLHKLYDINLIWDDLLSFVPMSVINTRLHLNYILPTNLSHNNKTSAKTAIIFYIYSEDLIDYCYNYAKNIPENIDIFIINTTDAVQQFCKKKFNTLSNKIEYRLQQNRGRDNAALLITCKDVIENYEYLCFVHSKKSPHFENTIRGEFFRDHNFLSLLYNNDYIKNIIEIFDKNKRLGILCPLIPNTSNYACLIFDKWTCNWNNAKNFIKNKLKLDIPLDKDVMGPFGNMFWCRTAALKTLSAYPWRFEDFPEEPLTASDGLLTHTIERITSSLAQYDGYYTAWVSPDFYAEAYLNNFYYKYRNTQNLQINNISLRSFKDAFHHTKNKIRYWRYKLLSKITLGNMRKHYKRKKKELKERIRQVRRFLKRK